MMNITGLPGVSLFDVNNHLSIQQIDVDQAIEDRRLFMESLNQRGVGLIDAQIPPTSPEKLRSVEVKIH